MTSFFVNLNLISDIKCFVDTTNAVDCKVTCKSGLYIVNGKSIMGLFSLDLSKPIEVTLDTDDTEVISKFDKYMDNQIVE